MVMHSIREYENEIYMPLLGFALCMCHAIPAAYLKKNTTCYSFCIVIYIECTYTLLRDGKIHLHVFENQSHVQVSLPLHCSLAQKPNKIKVIAIAYFSMPEHTKISNNFNLLGFCANLTCTGRETSACD